MGLFYRKKSDFHFFIGDYFLSPLLRRFEDLLFILPAQNLNLCYLIVFIQALKMPNEMNYRCSLILCSFSALEILLTFFAYSVALKKKSFISIE